MGKKFDICIMNPPYGSRKTGDEFLHQKFVERCNNVSNNNIVVMPFKIIYDTSTDKTRLYYKSLFDKTLISVEEVDSNIFKDTCMPNVSIYIFSKQRNNTIQIIDLKGNNYNIETLTDFVYGITKYDKQILNLLKIDIKEANAYACLVAKDKTAFEKWCNSLSKKSKKIYLTANSANGGMNAKFFTKTVGKIFSSIDNLIDNFKERKGATCNIMLFNSIREAENCRTAMNNNVLRFALYKIQDNQSMRKKCYQYIPDIDWTDDRVKTDEGLLEVCGCPKDKIKEYAEYCKNIIERVDNGERP